MAPKYIAFFVFIFVVGTILGLVIEEGVLGVGEQSTLNSLLVWEQIGTEETWGVFNTLGFVSDYFGALWKALTWNFVFFEGNWVYLKWILWVPLAAMAVWGLVITFISLIQRVLS